MHLPVNGEAWLSDIADSFVILATDLTPLFAIAGAGSLLWAMARSRCKRETRAAFVCSLGYFIFLFALHRVVMPQAVAMPIVMILVLGLALAVDHVWQRLRGRIWRYALPAGVAILAALLIIPAHYGFIYGLTHNDTGLEMIALAKSVPRDTRPILMLPWGPRFDAVAFSKYVTKENADLPIVTHKADFAVLSRDGSTLYTSKDTFYGFPLAWWQSQIGRAYLSSPAYGLVAIRHEPTLAAAQAGEIEVAHGIMMEKVNLCTSQGMLKLAVVWRAASKPDADLSVFVHLLGADSAVMAQADSSAPVYGWYPATKWTAGEVVVDQYQLPRLPKSAEVSLGMYEQPTPGQFKNYGTTTIPVASVQTCP
jgi:hypothetical protein